MWVPNKGELADQRRRAKLPSDKPEVYLDAAGRPTTVAKLDNTGVTYREGRGIRDPNAAMALTPLHLTIGTLTTTM